MDVFWMPMPWWEKMQSMDRALRVHIEPAGYREITDADILKALNLKEVGA